MLLLTKANKKALPALKAQAKVADPIVHVKLFNPTGAATWYLLELDPEENLAFALCDLYGDGGELGYVSLDELAAFRGRFGLGIERDLHFIPKPLSEVKAVRA